jgi:hypothetical protein
VAIVIRTRRSIFRRRPVRFAVLIVVLGLLFVSIAEIALAGRRGSNLGDRFVSFGAAFDLGAFISAEQDLDDQTRELELLRTDFDQFISDIRPITVVSRVLGHVPWIGGQLGSEAALVDRVSADMFAASITLSSMTELRTAYQDVGRVRLDSLDSIRSSEFFVSAARQIAGRFGDAREHVAPHRPSRFVKPAFFPLADWRRLDALESRLDAAMEIGPTVSHLLADSIELRLMAQSFLAPIAGPEPDLADLSRRLTGLYERIEKIRTVLASHPDVVNQTVQFDAVLGAMSLIANGASSAAGSLASVMEVFDVGQNGIIGNGDGLGRAFDAVERERATLTSSLSLLSRGNSVIAEARQQSNSLMSFFEPSLVKILELADSLEAAVGVLKDLGPLARILLGLEGPRTFLILGHSADELRATGGFVSAIWLVTVDAGDLTEISYFDVVQVDDYERISEYPAPPIPLKLHMNAEVLLLRDVSWEPDFPSVATLAREMFEIGQQRGADGVVAINQWTFQIILDALNEIEIIHEGAAINADTFLKDLEVGTDLTGRGYMDGVFRSIINRLKQPISQAHALRLAVALNEALRRHELLINLTNPDSQSSLVELGWAGGLRDLPGDYLFVVDSNVGWSKVDRNIDRTVFYRLNMVPNGRSLASLTLSYENRSGPDARNCDHQFAPEYLELSYPMLKQACYWNYVRTYVPPGSRVRGATGARLAPGSVAAETGTLGVGESILDLTSAYNKEVFGSLLVVPPGEMRDITFLYDVENIMTENQEGLLSYQLLIQPQPGARGRDTFVEILIPNGYAIESFSLPEFASLQSGKIGYHFRLDEDFLISLDLERIGT